MTLEQAIEQEEWQANHFRKLEKLIREENPTIFYDEVKTPEIEYHEQVAVWLKELLLIKQTRKKLNENNQNDDIIICSKCGQKVIKSMKMDYENYYCFCPYCGTQMNDNK